MIAKILALNWTAKNLIKDETELDLFKFSLWKKNRILTKNINNNNNNNIKRIYLFWWSESSHQKFTKHDPRFESNIHFMRAYVVSLPNWR